MNPWIHELGEKFLAPNEVTGSLELLECSRRTNPESPIIWHGDRSFPLEHCHRLEFDLIMVLYEQALEYAATLGELADRLSQKRS
jgi:hypothetical protein